MSQRVGSRIFQSFRQNITSTFKLNQRQTRTFADTASQPVAPQQSKFQQLWNSEVGPKTVHFWAPVMKWGVALAGAADFARPAESLSITQNGALMATGLIWTRWCFIIKPRNVLLASVNFLLGCVGATQVARILLWRRSQEGKSAGEILKEEAHVDAQAIKSAAKDGADKVKA